MGRAVRLIIVALVLYTAARPAAADVQNDRLVALGRVWGQARYLHPARDDAARG